MKLIAVIVAISVITDGSTIAQTERLTSLLADGHAFSNRSGAVAFCECIGISVSLNGCTKILGRHQVQVLNIVGVQRSSFSARRAFRNRDQTIPSITLVVNTGSILTIQNTILNAGFKQMLTSGIPFDFCSSTRHNFILLFLII